MKTRPVDIKPFKELGNPAFAIDTPRDHISLGSLVLCVAKKQSGKTFFLSNLLYQLKQAGCMDRVFCLSDTFDSNKKMLENLEITSCRLRGRECPEPQCRRYRVSHGVWGIYVVY